MIFINHNGRIIDEFTEDMSENRGFLYADALFDTLIYKNNSFIYLENHFFRLLAGMRQLRMEIPTFFTQEFWKNEMLKTIKANTIVTARVRTTIFRNSGGLYTPNTNAISFTIHVAPFERNNKETYTIGLYKENHLNTSALDTIKTTGRLNNVLASIYTKEHGFDNCILINHKKQVAEAVNGNVFAVFGTVIVTPALSEGCIAGVIREKIIDFIANSETYSITEREMFPYELQKADELFITNSALGIQPVTHYKRKEYSCVVSEYLREMICK